ncbi:hypothetical protein QVD17_35639 [Tagetes erecta]|uniref:Membrane-associated kinase regulator 6 n=1 Tax=Tagetes erecta TaxID=13708 RepID=A0AAD8NGN5_TARER|nr:hypothetical protein QVD17_35639 [Tagetes erecta]
MEASQPLSVESFSYTWLVHRNPSLDTPNRSFRLSFDAATSFIEMDPNLTPSKRFTLHQDFDFNMPNSQAPTTLVHADKLISNGTLVSSKSHSGSIYASPLPPATKEEGRFRKCRSMSLSKCNKVPKIIIQKYIDFVRPLWCRMIHGRTNSSRIKRVENWECSSASGSRTSGVCLPDNIRRSGDSESSIHEAVVHCKKTIGMN